MTTRLSGATQSRDFSCLGLTCSEAAPVDRLMFERIKEATRKGKQQRKRGRKQERQLIAERHETKQACPIHSGSSS